MKATIELEDPERGFLIEELMYYKVNKNKTMSILNYFRETQGELSHVNWPTKKQAATFSLVVILISILTAVLLGLFDFIFARLLNLVIN